MRIWDIHPRHLCRKHVLAEHRELHGLWNILTTHGGIGGYARHPETLRWVGKTAALYRRHQALVAEMKRRGWHHHTPLDKRFASGDSSQRTYLQTVAQQRVLLRNKPCECLLHHR